MDDAVSDPAPSPTHYDIARGILASVVNTSKAPTRHERLEVAQLAATLALVDELRAIESRLQAVVRALHPDAPARIRLR